MGVRAGAPGHDPLAVVCLVQLSSPNLCIYLPLHAATPASCCLRGWRCRPRMCWARRTRWGGACDGGRGDRSHGLCPPAAALSFLPPPFRAQPCPPTNSYSAQGVYVLMSGLDYERLVLSAGTLKWCLNALAEVGPGNAARRLLSLCLPPPLPPPSLPLPQAPWASCRPAWTPCCRTCTSAPSLGAPSGSSRWGLRGHT